MSDLNMSYKKMSDFVSFPLFQFHLKDYKWFLSQNQRVRDDFFGYRRCEAIAKHIKSFSKRHYSKRTSVPGLYTEGILLET